MTGYFINFEGTIYQGTPFSKETEMMPFSGNGISSRNPEWDGDADPEGTIFKEVAKHFGIKPPFTIYLRIWHPSNYPTYQIKKLWVSP